MREGQRDGQGGGRHSRAVCQHGPGAEPAKICRCVCVEEDLGLGKVSVVSGGASVLDFMCVFVLLIIFSYIQPCG